MPKKYLMKYIQTSPLKRDKIIKIITISAGVLFIIIFLLIFINYKYIFKSKAITKNKKIENQKKEIKINDNINIIVEKNNNEATTLKQGESEKHEVKIDGNEYFKYTYIVKEGDTLWKISKRFLNDAYAWHEIQKYNEEIIKDPHWIEINDKIIIYIPKNKK